MSSPSLSPPVAVDGHVDPRDRSDSVHSTSSNHVRYSAPSIKSASTAPASANSLQPPDSRHSESSKKSKKSRALSNSSHMSGVAKALARSALQIASPTNADSMSSAQLTHSKRSPFLVRGNGGDDASIAHPDGHEEALVDDDYDEDDDTESDGDDHLPVTGFAVASNRRQADFHAMFSGVDEGDYLIEGERVPALITEKLIKGQTMDVHWRRRS